MKFKKKIDFLVLLQVFILSKNLKKIKFQIDGHWKF